MPYAYRKIRNQDAYKVFNKLTGVIHANHTTLDKAKSQVRLLSAMDKKKGKGVESNLYTDEKLGRMSNEQLFALRQRATDPQLWNRIRNILEGRVLAEGSPSRTGVVVQEVPMGEIQLPPAATPVVVQPPTPINLFGLINPRPERQRPPVQVLIDNRRRPREDEGGNEPSSKKSKGGKGIKKGKGAGSSKAAEPVPVITEEAKKRVEELKKQIEGSNLKKSEEITKKIAKKRQEDRKKIAKEDPEYQVEGEGLKGGAVPLPPTLTPLLEPSIPEQVVERFRAPDGRIIEVTGQRNIDLLRRNPAYQLMREGSGLPVGEIQQFLYNSYQVPPADSIGDFMIDKKLSGRRVQVYKNRNTPQAVVVHRGTQGSKDLATDIYYTSGGDPKGTARFKHAAEVQKKAEDKYGADNVTTLGHSLGAKIASTVGENSKEIINLNKIVSPLDAVQKTSGKEINIRSTGDTVSSLLPLRNAESTITIPSESYNPFTEPFTEHKTNILERLPAGQIIGKGAAISAIRQAFRGRPYVIEGLERIESANTKETIFLAVFRMARRYVDEEEDIPIGDTPFDILFDELKRYFETNYQGGFYQEIAAEIINNRDIPSQDLKEVVVDWIYSIPEFQAPLLDTSAPTEAEVVGEPPIAEATLQGEGIKGKLLRNILRKKSSVVPYESRMFDGEVEVMPSIQEAEDTFKYKDLSIGEISTLIQRQHDMGDYNNMKEPLKSLIYAFDVKTKRGYGVKRGGKMVPPTLNPLEEDPARMTQEQLQRRQELQQQRAAAAAERAAAERALFDAWFQAQQELEEIEEFQQRSTPLTTRPAYRAFYNYWRAYTNLRNGVRSLQTTPQQVNQFMLQQYNRIRGQFSPSSIGVRDRNRLLLNRRSDEVLSELQQFVLDARDRTVPEEDIFGNSQRPMGEYTAAEIARLMGDNSQESPSKKKRGEGIKKGGAIKSLINTESITNILPLTRYSTPQEVFNTRRDIIQFFNDNVSDGMTINQFSSVNGFIREQLRRIVGSVNTGAFGINENTILNNRSREILDDVLSIPQDTKGLMDFLFGTDPRELQSIGILMPNKTVPDGEYIISSIPYLLREYYDDLTSPFIEHNIEHYDEPDEDDEEILSQFPDNRPAKKQRINGGSLAKKISPPIKKMGNPWVEHIKKFAAKKGINYAQAMKHPDIKKGYKKGGMVEEDAEFKKAIIDATIGNPFMKAKEKDKINCPYCDAPLNYKSLSRHIASVHPGFPVEYRQEPSKTNNRGLRPGQKGKGMMGGNCCMAPVVVRGRGMPTTREAAVAEAYNESQLGANGGKGYISL